MTSHTTAIIQTIGLNKSINPSIEECERFYKYLGKRFNLPQCDDLIVLIHETHANTRGYFRSIGCEKIWQEGTQPLNSIVLSSHILGDSGIQPYLTLTHELAHYLNFKKGIKDCTTSQYHNKKFKAMAESLLLRVEKFGRYGWADTTATEEFKEMLLDFGINEIAFKVFQHLKEPTEKKGSRMLLFECECGCKIRSARNEDKPLWAECGYCNKPFLAVAK